MRPYAWRIPAAMIPPFRGFHTYQIVLPRTFAPEPLESLVGSDLWLFSTLGTKTYLYAKVRANIIELFKEGPRNGDALVRADLDRSFYFLPTDSDDFAPWQLQAALLYTPVDTTVHAISERDSQALEAFASTAIRTSFASIDVRLLHKMADIPSGRITYSTVVNMVHALKRRVSVGDLWNNPERNDSWNVYASASYSILRQRVPSQEHLIAMLLDRYMISVRQVSQPGALPNVDTTLVPIDPDQIVTRNFVAPGGGSATGGSALALFKTSQAESRHQQLLRDLVLFLKQRGFIPKENDNVDLAVETPSHTLLIEVKSSTPDNFFRQAVQGAIQALYYRHIFQDAGIAVLSPLVIIEESVRADQSAAVGEFLASLGVRLLIYRKLEEWPSRIEGIENVLASLK